MKRSVGKWAILAPVGLAVALLAGRTHTDEPVRPNILLIMADDLGFHDLGCYGHPKIKTPVLDQLAEEGIRLTGYHSGATVCTPSRMALLTGAYPVRLGWTEGVIGYKMGFRDGLSPEALTMAEIFRSEGYATGISGKWHIGDQPETRPGAQGFDSSYYISHSNNQTKKLFRGDEVVEERFDNRRLTEQFTEEAKRFIRQHRDEPFFLYLPYSAVHFPVEPHPDWEGRSDFGDYGDLVEEMDARIGELLELLVELKIADRTLVVFNSDNGPQNGQAASALPFRGAKWSALEGGTRVPCIVRWPGRIPAGRTSDDLIAAIDLLPTLCRAAGIDWNAKSKGSPPIDGVDVLGTLNGRAASHARDHLIHWHGMHAEPQAVRIGDWKVFFDRSDALEGPGTELATPEQQALLKPYRKGLKKDGTEGPFVINLAEDPGETKDLSGADEAKVDQLVAQARELVKGVMSGTPLLIHSPRNDDSERR